MGSPNRAGTAKAHGEALGAEEIKLTREALDWPHEPFVDAQGGSTRPGMPRPRAPNLEADWDERQFDAYKADAYPEAGRRVHAPHEAGDAAGSGYAQTAVDAVMASATPKPETVASRKASQLALEAFTKPRCPSSWAARPT